VLAKATLATSENDPALRDIKAVADYYSWHRNQKLDFTNGRTNKAVEHLVSVIKPAILKALIGRKLETEKSDLKKDSSSSLNIWRRWLSHMTSSVMW
jgi:hypothetical protein